MTHRLARPCCGAWERRSRCRCSTPWVPALSAATRIDRGLESDGVVTTRVFLPWQRYGTPDDVRAFYHRAVDAIERLPGVISAAPFHLPPGTGTTGLSSPFQFEGRRRTSRRRTSGPTGYRNAAVLLDAGDPDRERARLCAHRHRRCAARGDRARERRRALLARRGVDRQTGPDQPAVRVGDGGGGCRRLAVPRAHQQLDDGLLPGPAVVPLTTRQPCDSHRAGRPRRCCPPSATRFRPSSRRYR